MNYDRTEILLKNSPTWKILRSRNAVLMITFFYTQFKKATEPEIPNSVLVQKLADYLDELNYQDEDEEVDNEIRQIKREGFVKTYENYQIQERFEDITKLANELVGDFKEVEDNFKIIVRDIYEKQSNNLLTKGKILQYTFDSLDELKG